MTKGQRIKLMRKAHGLTQIELAQRIHTSKQNLYKYENDIITNIPSDKVELLSEILEISPGYIMGWDDEPITFDDEDAPIKVDSLIKPYLDMLREMPEDYRQVALNGIKRTYDMFKEDITIRKGKD